MKKIFAFTIFLFVALCALSVYAQTEEIPGVALYKQGRAAEAIKELEQASKSNEFKNNPIIWNYMGLAYYQLKEQAKSRKAFERATKLAPDVPSYRINYAQTLIDNKQYSRAHRQLDSILKFQPNNAFVMELKADAYLKQNRHNQALQSADMAIALDKTRSTAYIVKSDIMVDRFSINAQKDMINYRQHKNLIFQAKTSLEEGIKHVANENDRTRLEHEFEAIDALWGYLSKHLPDPALPLPEPVSDENNRAAKFLSLPRADYTEEARMKQIQGKVSLLVLMKADGTIRPLVILKKLPNGLTEQAIMATFQIKFEPKIIDGKAVSSVNIVEYSFNIY